MVIARAKRLHLRQFISTDAGCMNAIFGDPDVMRFGDGVQSADWVQAWIARCNDELYPTWGYGPWAVVETDTECVIGYCGLFHFDDAGGSPETEIGYRLARSRWGRGYATEAAIAVRDYAFNHLGLNRLIALIDPSNRGSIRVAEKLGMQYERDVMLEGYSHPDHIYAIARP